MEPKDLSAHPTDQALMGATCGERQSRLRACKTAALNGPVQRHTADRARDPLLGLLKRAACLQRHARWADCNREGGTCRRRRRRGCRSQGVGVAIAIANFVAFVAVGAVVVATTAVLVVVIAITIAIAVGVNLGAVVVIVVALVPTAAGVVSQSPPWLLASSSL